MEERKKGVNPKLIHDEKEIEYHRQQEQKEKEHREKVQRSKSISITELRKQPELCETCQKFHNCETLRKAEYIGKIIRVCGEYEDVSKLPYKSLQDVYGVFLKWFPTLDTTRIDTRLAWYTANEYGVGDSIWVIETARSGFTKTTLSDAFRECPKIIPIGQLSPKALISGQTQKVKTKKGYEDVPVRDLGMRFRDRNRCAIISESAHLKAMLDGSKRELFASLKQLHDGELIRDTGTNVSKHYKNCNTSMWFNSTPDFQNETIIHQEIGVCYLVDSIPPDTKNDSKAIRKAIEDRKKSKQIKQETTFVVKCYLAHHHLKEMKLSKEDYDFITREANRLKLIRTTGSFDKYRDELEYIPQSEFPARVGKQLSKYLEALMSLKENYSKDRAKKIIKRIVDGSGDQVMVKILRLLDSLRISNLAEDKDNSVTVYDIVTAKGLGTRTIKRRLELLTALEFLKKVFKEKGNKKWVEYSLRDDIEDEDWQSLFRHPIVKKSTFQVT